jgi:hypothetical protein
MIISAVNCAFQNNFSYLTSVLFSCVYLKFSLHLEGDGASAPCHRVHGTAKCNKLNEKKIYLPKMNLKLFNEIKNRLKKNCNFLIYTF